MEFSTIIDASEGRKAGLVFTLKNKLTSFIPHAEKEVSVWIYEKVLTEISSAF